MSRAQKDWFRLSTAERGAWAGFLAVHSRVVRELDAELESACGLSLNSYDVLVQLQIAPDRRLRMSELADAVLLSRAGITRLVERLEREGLIERHRGKTDSRQVFAGLTRRGTTVLNRCTKTHLDGVRTRFLAPLSEARKQHLAEAWQEILSADADTPAPGAGTASETER